MRTRFTLRAWWHLKGRHIPEFRRGTFGPDSHHTDAWYSQTHYQQLAEMMLGKVRAQSYGLGTMSAPSISTLRRIDPTMFKAQLLELAKQYRIICMNAQHYAEVRKYGRDQLSILTRDPEEEPAEPFHLFGRALGIQGAIYVDPVWTSDPNSVWAMLVCDKTLDETLKVSARLGETWIEIPINFPSE